MTGPSEKAIEAAWDGAQGSPLRAARSFTLNRVYPIIREDVIREAAEALRRVADTSTDARSDAIRWSADLIEREFGGE